LASRHAFDRCCVAGPNPVFSEIPFSKLFNGGFLGIGGLAKRKLICHLLDENSAMILQMGVYFAPEITARWLGVKKEKM